MIFFSKTIVGCQDPIVGWKISGKVDLTFQKCVLCLFSFGFMTAGNLNFAWGSIMDWKPLTMWIGHLTQSQVMKKYVFILVLKGFEGICGQKYHN